MALNNTYFETRGKDVSVPIPDSPGYTPPTPPTPPTPGSGSTPVIPRPTYSGETTVTFYNNLSDNNVVSKNLTEVTSASITVKDDMNLVNPTLIINGTIDCNYMHMLGRYYYIQCEAIPGGLTRITGHSDGLMSFASDIKSQYAIIERNSTNVNSYLPDPERKITAYKTSHAIKFSGSFSKTLQHYLLTTGNS